MVIDMEKRSWLWKRKSSEKSPGETDSSGSISSHSERYSDDQEALKECPNHNTQSPEITSKAAITSGEVHDSVKSLTEKLSAALVNVGAKEDLVKQHAKVAEEAVAGWEKAEKEGAILRQQLEAAVQQNLVLEVRVSHLDGALKECVRQLRQAKEENEQMVNDKLAKKTPVDPNFLLKLKSLEKENSTLKLELLSISEELEIRTIERDLSTQAAETASKHQLESIKKAAKIEAECRRLQALARKSSSSNDHKSVSASSLYVDSLTDSQSDSGERLNAVEIDTRRMNRVEPNECEPSCSDSWASALIAELDQFRIEKGMPKNLISCSVEIDIMDDFLEMERLAALPFIETKYQPNNVENALRAELENMSQRVVELEDELEKIESEKAKLEKALNASQDCFEASKTKLTETENRLEDLQKELSVANESKEVLEFQLVGVEVEASTMSAKVDSLKGEVEKERCLSAEMAFKCQELEAELTRKQQEVEDQQTACSNGELKVKQEDIAVAAGKLAECQKTIASLGRQLKSLATLEDFLIDTANLPGFSGGGSLIPKASGELWKLHSNDTFIPKSDLDPSKLPGENPSPSVKCGPGESPGSSSSSTSSAVSLNHGISAKSKNGFGKLFSRSKSGIQLDSHQ